MGFWIFMYICDLLIPFAMLFFGWLFRHHAPKEVNSWYGYRTLMSTKNQDTWQFAQQYFAKCWRTAGWVTLIPSLIIPFFYLGKPVDKIGTYGGILCFVQMVPMFISIFLTEKALRKTFHKDGIRK